MTRQVAKEESGMMTGEPRLFVAFLGLAVFLATEGLEPPRWKDGALPQIPQQTTAWGQVLLEVSAGAAGQVERMTILRSTPPFTEALQKAVAGWRFEPAMAGRVPSPGRILVAAVFRPPALAEAPGAGEPPRDLAAPSDSIPFPTTIRSPRYPPRALGDGVVLVEAVVGGDGAVRAATILKSAPGFDDSAVQASLQWKFRAARRDGSPVFARALLVFAFRQPVLSKPHRG